VEENTEDWQMVPDEDGNLHLVDINAVNMDAEPQFVATDIVFRLFTPQNPTAAQIIQLNNNAQLTASNYQPGRATRFHIHGWNGGGATTGAGQRNALIAQLNCNVFTVDWGVGAQTANYVAARNRVNLVGQTVANFIDWLNTSRGQAHSAITVIGHSLGAHCAGAAGKRTRLLIGAVVSLDPAGPLFSVADSANRVHHTDATHVQNIVTDAGALGFSSAAGHSNFYPNGGTNQPGCNGSTCNHSRVNDFYQHSINHANHFGAIRCASCANIANGCVASGASRRLGGHTVPIDGTAPALTCFHLTTGATAPFAHGPR